MSKDSKSKYIHDYSYLTDIGRVRLTNEDRALVLNYQDEILIIVADGMGGHNKGDYASKRAIDMISNAFKNRRFKFLSILAGKLWLHNIVNKTNKEIYNIAESNPLYKGMGTTLVVALIKNNNMVILNAGDSRAYIYKNNDLKLLSEDDSYVDFLKRTGKVTESEANERPDKNILLNALGIYPSISFDSRMHRYHNEPLLLCSDGVYNNLSKTELVNILANNENSKNKVMSIILKANENGGSDNLGVAIYSRKENK